MALTNAERQAKYRQSKLKQGGNHHRLQLVIDHKTHAELFGLITRFTRLNNESGTMNHPTTKQDIIAAAIHKYAQEFGLEYEDESAENSN
jgi:hypothetical protein